DGTLAWDSTTIVIVEAHAGDHVGLGYTYGDIAAARLVDREFSGIILGRDPMAVRSSWMAMVHSVRNLGRPGIVSHAIAAVDVALWDLKARVLGLSLASLLGSARAGIP